jgi:hypothetical protein
MPAIEQLACGRWLGFDGTSAQTGREIDKAQK